MIHVKFVEPGGAVHELDATEGRTAMETALSNDVPGIEAVCGGAASCATCHVYVDPAWANRITPISEVEDMLLDLAANRQANSRLSCQIKITPEIDGIVFQVPEPE